MDRGIRAILGLGLLAAGAYARSWWGLLGLALLLNAATGICYGYRLCGFSTYKGTHHGEPS